ncbi:hypothetical protein [Spongiactinospora rosea]|uniref:hypothetical protein n=1 Tax=Spongiactinospora rosea TaxID=2248750 RepID=UPI0011C05DD7|nr:hypothetical protein [Spongiactinospora rosea]
MASRDWAVSGRVALRWINGKLVVLTPEKTKTLHEVIAEYEEREANRQKRELQILGGLIDKALSHARRGA